MLKFGTEVQLTNSKLLAQLLLFNFFLRYLGYFLSYLIIFTNREARLRRASCWFWTHSIQFFLASVEILKVDFKLLIPILDHLVKNRNHFTTGYGHLVMNYNRAWKSVGYFLSFIEISKKRLKLFCLKNWAKPWCFARQKCP